MSDLVLNVLRKVQDRNGFVSEDDLKKISKELKIPVSQLYGVASFYTMLHTKDVGKNIIELCGSPSCYLNDGWDVEKFLEKEVGAEFGQTSRDGKISLFKTSCIGCCDQSPALLLNGSPVTNLTKAKVRELIKKCRSSKRLIWKQ